jgi:predicted nuclease of restriction endonuclease-like (RecB) superfamily
VQLVENTIKDSYIFDFLSLWDEYKEKDLEANLLKNLEKFILELEFDLLLFEGNLIWKLNRKIIF